MSEQQSEGNQAGEEHHCGDLPHGGDGEVCGSCGDGKHPAEADGAGVLQAGQQLGEASCGKHGEQRDAQHAQHDENHQIEGIGTLGAERLGNGDGGEKGQRRMRHAIAKHRHAKQRQKGEEPQLSRQKLQRAPNPPVRHLVEEQEEEGQFVGACHLPEKTTEDGVVRGKGEVLRLCLRNCAQQEYRQRKQQQPQNQRAASRQRTDAQRRRVDAHQRNQGSSEKFAGDRKRQRIGGTLEPYKGHATTYQQIAQQQRREQPVFYVAVREGEALPVQQENRHAQQKLDCHGNACAEDALHRPRGGLTQNGKGGGEKEHGRQLAGAQTIHDIPPQ